MKKEALAIDYIPKTSSIKKLKESAKNCQGCDLYKNATQTVFGEGNIHAPLLLVGEQPGNKEDLIGKPFVGPAGRLLHNTLAELDIDESLIYVTNTVKHFKFAQNGNTRQHRSPSEHEIRACKPWLLAELESIQPKVVLCLGATSAKALIDPNFHLHKERGIFVNKTHYMVSATYHPSAILRAKRFKNDEAILTYFKEDLLLAYQKAL